MSSIITRIGVVLAGALILLSIGCIEERTPGQLIDPNTGKHPVQWETAAGHGAAAKGAASSTTGFSVCQECHSTDFSGGISKSTCLSTAGCHGAGVKAPHSPAPWRGETWTHVNTDQSNAPVCATCHTNGANSSVQPSPFDPGAAPGCFNSTMCHGAVGHPPLWENPFYHGAAAKKTPGAATGFSYCQVCHGNDFTGGVALQTCLNTAGCHGANVNAPHSPKPWRGDTRTHTDTDTGNAPVCATCHTNGANSSVQPSPFDPGAAPGCFNNTLCHAAVGHPAGWDLPTAHGATAKSAPSPSAGFSSCQFCHGNDFTGGNALTSCLNTAGCHGAGINAPHSAAWLLGSNYTHVDTDQGNASVCALCHTNGLNSPIAPPSPPAAAGTPPGCFNNTLCHAVPACGTCHAIPPNSTVSPNVAGQHAPHIAVSPVIVCGTCHMGAGSGTALHRNNIVDVILDPTFNAKSGAAAYNPASFTCSNISCHGGSRTQSVTQAGQNPRQSTVTLTPSWLTGTIDVSTDCTACHVLGSKVGTVVTPENNSYYSGRHYLHVWDPNNPPQPKLSCTACHDTTSLGTNHFTTLNTPAMEGPASATIWSFVNYDGVSCTPACHGNKTW